MDNKDNKALTDEELDQIFGGYDYSVDLSGKTVTVLLEENEDPVEALKELPGKLPLPLDADSQILLDAKAQEMQTKGFRNCRATFSLSFISGIRITGIELY